MAQADDAGRRQKKADQKGRQKRKKILFAAPGPAADRP
jgi:hypothetical protein